MTARHTSGSLPPSPPPRVYSREDNDAKIQQLIDAVRDIKKKNVTIGGEVKSHLTLLDQLQGVMDRANNGVVRTTKNLTGVDLSSVRHMWLLYVFAAVVFLFLYLLLKFGR